MRQLALKNNPALKVLLNATKDYEDLFLGKRSGHLTEYMYDDLYQELLQEEGYYLNRSEIKVLKNNKYEIADIIGEKCNLIEIGPGPEYVVKTKVLPLLKTLKNLSSYTAVDINMEYATKAFELIRKELHNIVCTAYQEDITKQLTRHTLDRTCLLFLGSTFCNLSIVEIKKALSSFYNVLKKGEHLVFSMDYNKDSFILERAYNNPSTKKLAFNIFNYFKDHFMIKGFDPTKFKFKYEWSYIYNAAYWNLVSTTEQKFLFNDNIITIPKNKKYHLFTSKRIEKKLIDEMLDQQNFTIIKNFVDERNITTLYIVQK